MPVVKRGRLVGVVSERDLLRASLSALSGVGNEERRAFLHAVEISEVMSEPPITIGPEARVEEAAHLMAQKAARLCDAGEPCGAEANAAKLLGGKAGHAACQQAMFTLGGMGYAKEFHIERLLREVLIARLAPVSEQLILSHIAERVLHQPKSY